MCNAVSHAFADPVTKVQGGISSAISGTGTLVAAMTKQPSWVVGLGLAATFLAPFVHAAVRALADSWGQSRRDMRAAILRAELAEARQLIQAYEQKLAGQASASSPTK